MKTEVEWIPCAERLPDDEERVLIAVDGDWDAGWFEGDTWYTGDGAPVWEPVTHWARVEMPNG